MKINLIGTGSIGSRSHSACTLVEGNILIDVPNGTVKKLLQNNIYIKEIEICIITHCHGDHFFDLPFLLLNRKFHAPDKKLYIIGPEELENRTNELINLAFPGESKEIEAKANVEWIKVKNNETIEIKDTLITPIKVKHSDKLNCYGYLLSKDDKIIGFSGDSTYCKAIEEIVQKADLSVLEMSTLKTTNAHMGINDITEITKKYQDKTIVATHMHQQTSEEAKKEKLEDKIKNLVIGADGKELLI